jgi:hypothetical protein
MWMKLAVQQRICLLFTVYNFMSVWESQGEESLTMLKGIGKHLGAQLKGRD